MWRHFPQLLLLCSAGAWSQPPALVLPAEMQFPHLISPNPCALDTAQVSFAWRGLGQSPCSLSKALGVISKSLKKAKLRKNKEEGKICITVAEVHNLGVVPAPWSEWELPPHPEQTGISSTSHLAIISLGSLVPEQTQAGNAKQSNQQRKGFLI